MSTEICKDIPGFEGRYSISNKGRVYSRISKKFLKPKIHRDGYLHIILYRPDGTWKDEYIHRLVAEAFCDKEEGCNVVNHLDSNRKNNDAGNLQWTDPKGNTQHALMYGNRRKNVMFAEYVNSKDINVYKNGVYIGTFTGTGWSFEEVI